MDYSLETGCGASAAGQPAKPEKEPDTASSRFSDVKPTASTDTIRVAGVYRESIVDGPGFRFAIFCQGCPHHCPGCHNPETWPLEGGTELSVDRLYEEAVKNPIVKGVTFSGGEPFCQPEGFYTLAVKLKEQGMNLLAYTGYTYEELLDIAINRPAVGDLLGQLDLLVDGRYEENLRDISLQFRGSANQRIIDMKETRLQGRVVLAEDYMR